MGDEAIVDRVRHEVRDLCEAFPIYSE